MRAARAAAGPGRPSVSLGRPGEHGRARAHAAQPAHRGRTVPRELRRRDRPRRAQPSGRPGDRARRRVRALHRSLRDMAEYGGAPPGRCRRPARGRRRRPPAASPMESRHAHVRGDRVAGGPRATGARDSTRSCPTSRPDVRRAGARRSAARTRSSSRRCGTSSVPQSPAPVPQTVTPVFGFTIIQLNMAYIREQMLPELAQRHFIHAEGDVYRVSVTSSDDPTKVLYRSDPGAPVERAHADATAGLLGRVDPAFFFARPPRAGDGDRDQPRGRRPAPRRDGRMDWDRGTTNRSAAGCCSCSIRADRSKRRWPPRAAAIWASASACCCC